MSDIWSAAGLCDIDTVRSLLEQDKTFANATDSYRMVALHHVAKSPNAKSPQALEVTKLLLENGAHPNEKNNNGITPLHLFAKNGALEAVQLIVSKDVEAPLGRTKDGKTPEDMATASGHGEVAKRQSG